MPHIISASRRTDIPRYYAAWFAQRYSAGAAEFRTVFGVRGSASLRPEDVLGYLFWTRLAEPFRANLRTLQADGVPIAFQHTITGYPRALEPHAPSLAAAIDDFLGVRAMLPASTCIEWRYDPIVLSDTLTPSWHAHTFRRIAAALQGATEVVNISFVEPYLKTLRRVPDSSVRYRALDPARHKTVAKRQPPPLQVGADGARLLGELAQTARTHGMQLRACANPEWTPPHGPAHPSQCCGPELFAAYDGFAARASRLSPAPSRAACRCVRSVDIGMDNTCVAGCVYCYVVSSQKAATANRGKHDPDGVSIVPMGK